jgi:hypothetical protein
VTKPAGEGEYTFQQVAPEQSVHRERKSPTEEIFTLEIFPKKTKPSPPVEGLFTIIPI